VPYTRAVRAALLLMMTIVAFPASASASTSHATNWETRGHKVVCGITRVWGTAFDPGTQAPLNSYWPGLQCSAAGIPRPRQGVGDPFVQLGQGRAGRARLVDESQNDLTSNAPFAALAAGSTWSLDHITCAVHGESVDCTNSVGHGFTMSTGHVHLF